MKSFLGRPRHWAFIVPALAFAIVRLCLAQHIPFGFWLYKAPIAAVTISSSVTITDANYTTYENTAVTINTGVVVTVQTSHALSWRSLTMVGTSQIVGTACTTSICYPIVLSVGGDVTIPSGAILSANGTGYLGGNNSNGYTTGNVTGGSAYSGGSHGGYGGAYSGSPAEVYDNLLQPTDMGGGGGSTGSGYLGGNGGGAIKLTVAGTLTINGLISANGLSGSVQGNYWQGSGAGGSIWISANTIATTAGGPVITANGVGNTVSGNLNNGSGGGRIAIYYTTLNTFAVTSTYVQAYGAAGRSSSYNGGSGTIYSQSSTETSGGDLLIAGPTNSTYKNTKVGVFGVVSSVSANTLTGSLNFIPATNVLIGNTLKPDITKANVISITANTSNTATASGSLTSLTATSKYFYVTDYTSTFNSLTITGSNAVDSGYLNILSQLSLPTGATLNVYDLNGANANLALAGTSAINAIGAISATTITTTGTSNAISAQSIAVSGAVNAANTSITASGPLSAASITTTGAGNSINAQSITSAGAMNLAYTTVSDSGALSATSITTTGTGNVINAQTLTASGAINTTSTSITAPTITVGGTITSANTTINAQSSNITGNATISGTSAVTSPTLVTNDLVLSGSSTVLTTLALTSNGSAALGGTSSVTCSTWNVTSGLSLNGTSSVTAPTATSSATYPLNITAASINVSSGTGIIVDGKGYLGGNNSNGYTTGNVTGGSAYSGGSHGGYGGAYSGSPAEVYDNLLQPTDMGGGGGSTGSGYLGGNGGGAIKLTVAGTLTINGLISANGLSGSVQGNYWQGSGAGGSIWISANTIATTAGGPVITANGVGNTVSGNLNNGSGGGRIAIYYTTLNTFAVTSTYVQAYGAAGRSSTYNGGSGTVYSYNQSNSKGLLLLDNANIMGTYNSGYSKLLLRANTSFDAVTVQRYAMLKQENTTYTFTINTLTIQTNGSVETPTNGAAGYGSWFSYTTLVGSPAPVEY